MKKNCFFLVFFVLLNAMLLHAEGSPYKKHITQDHISSNSFLSPQIATLLESVTGVALLFFSERVQSEVLKNFLFMLGGGLIIDSIPKTSKP